MWMTKKTSLLFRSENKIFIETRSLIWVTRPMCVKYTVGFTIFFPSPHTTRANGVMFPTVRTRETVEHTMDNIHWIWIGSTTLLYLVAKCLYEECFLT